MSEQMYLTSEGAARLKEELERLKGSEREELARRLRDANLRIKELILTMIAQQQKKA